MNDQKKGALLRVLESAFYSALIVLLANVATIFSKSNLFLQLQEPLALLIVLLKTSGLFPTTIPNPTVISKEISATIPNAAHVV